MITYDIGKYVREDCALDVEVVRTLPTISISNTFAAATKLKEELSAEVGEKVALQDDPVGQPLLEKYAGKLLRDKSEGQTFKVADVTAASPPPPLSLPLNLIHFAQPQPSMSVSLKVVDVNCTSWAGEDYWSATSVPVTLTRGSWIVPSKHIVGGGEKGKPPSISTALFSILSWPTLRTLIARSTTTT